MKNPYTSVKTDKVETYMTSNGDTYTQGMSVLSRGNDIVTELVGLPNVADDKHARIAQFARVDYFCEGCPEHTHTMDSFDFVNVHFANKPGNVVQLRQVLENANENYSYPIIIGDFNNVKS
jgi:coenzyme F420-reducing hydrogenase gamma subunit